MKEFKTTLDIVLKEFQEGVDFTVESKEKIIFHNEKIVNRFTQELQEEKFFKAVKKLIPSALCSYEESGSGWSRRCTFAFKPRNNKKDNSWEIEKQKNELIEESMGKKQVDKPEENLNRHFIDDGKGLTYSIEKKDQSKLIKETYHQPWSEEKEKFCTEKSENREVENPKAINQENFLIEQEANKTKTEDSSVSNEVNDKLGRNGIITIVGVFGGLIMIGGAVAWKKLSKK